MSSKLCALVSRKQNSYRLTHRIREYSGLSLMHNVDKAPKRVTDTTMADDQLEKLRAAIARPDDTEIENAKANGNVIHGHDYTNAQFVEIDKKYKDDVLSTSRHVNCLSLSILTRRTGPGSKYKGLGWRDLFAKRTSWDKFRWSGVENISQIAEKTAMNEDCMFRVWYCPPGLIHVEVDDEGTWTVHDILTLPGWMIIG